MPPEDDEQDATAKMKERAQIRGTVSDFMLLPWWILPGGIPVTRSSRFQRAFSPSRAQGRNLLR
jgi:hypothetical protein